MLIRVRHFSTFLISPRVPPYSGAFFLADRRGIVCSPKNVRFDAPNVIEILKLLWEAKKRNVQIITNGG